MENNNNGKIITVSFAIAGLLVGFIAHFVIQTIAASTSGNVAHMFNQDYVHHGVPIAVGFIVFALLQFNKNIVAWAEDVVTELKKIVWPSRKDTINMTIVVTIMVLLSGFVLGVFDFASGNIVDWILHINFQNIF